MRLIRQLVLLQCMLYPIVAAFAASKNTGVDTSRHSHTAGAAIQLVSWKPRVFVHRQLLNSAEAEALAHEAETYIHSGHNILSSPPSRVLASEASLLQSHAHEAQNVSKRAAHWVQLPERLSEPLTVVKYADGGYWKEHVDYFDPAQNGIERNGGQRLVSVLVELSSPPSGGEEVFPHTGSLDEHSVASASGSSACTRNRNAIKLQPGDAIAYWTMEPNGWEDPNSAVEACPAVGGSRVVAYKRFRVRAPLANSERAKSEQSSERE